MKILCVGLALATFGAGLAAPVVPTRAQSAEIRVLSSNGIRGPMEKIAPDYERASGQRVIIQYAASAVLRRSIENNDAFDLAILTPPIIDDLIKAGLIAAGTATDIAKTDLGVGIRAGAPKTDISTREALRRRLVAAKSITYAKEGAATATFNEILNKLGIYDVVKSRIVLQTVSRRQAESVAEGENELFFSPISEILSVNGVEVLGLFPQEFQSPIVMTAGLAARSANPQGARAFLQFLTGPKAAPVLRESGMDPMAR